MGLRSPRDRRAVSSPAPSHDSWRIMTSQRLVSSARKMGVALVLPVLLSTTCVLGRDLAANAGLVQVAYALDDATASDDVSDGAITAAEAVSATIEQSKSQADSAIADGQVAIAEAEEAAAAEAAEAEYEEYVSSWADRLDTYLSGTALEGYGRNFAEAAISCGIDPRLAVAISTVESSTGSVCFLSHNAWGWGSYSWDTWEDAIADYVSQLAANYSSLMTEGEYGLTVTTSMASVYCATGSWYSNVTSVMSQI